MARVKKTANEERIIVFSQTVNGTEPKFAEGEVTEKNFKEKLQNALNWYSKESTQEKSKEWYLESNPEHTKYKKLADHLFGNSGFLTRMVSRGFTNQSLIEPALKNKRIALDEALEKLTKEATEIVVDVKPKAIGFDKTVMNALELVDIYVDSYITGKKLKLSVDITNLNRNQQIQVKSYVEKNLEEFENAHKVKTQDGDFAYSLNAAECKVIATDFRELLNKLNTSTSTTRKPRAIKEKPIAKIVEWVKFSNAYNEYTGLQPAKVIGAKVLLAFNIKGRKAILYYADGDAGLSFKGTSLINVDEKLSKGKTLRKPEEMLKSLTDASKLSIDRTFNRLTAMEWKPATRCSDDVIFLKVWN
jgi:hypothetical protein